MNRKLLRSRYAAMIGFGAFLMIGRAFADDLDAMSRDDKQWVMPAKNYASTRYSTLDQINAENAKDLKVAWTFETGVKRGQEAAPIVVGDTMYVVTPYPNILYALDLKNPGSIQIAT